MSRGPQVSLRPPQPCTCQTRSGAPGVKLEREPPGRCRDPWLPLACPPPHLLRGAPHPVAFPEGSAHPTPLPPRWRPPPHVPAHPSHRGPRFLPQNPSSRRGPGLPPGPTSPPGTWPDTQGGGGVSGEPVETSLSGPSGLGCQVKGPGVVMKEGLGLPPMARPWPWGTKEPEVQAKRG